MKRIIANKYGGPEVLFLEKGPKPTPNENEVLIKINATSVTAASTYMRSGKPYFGRLFMGFTSPKAKTLGTDLSGVVEARGSRVTKFQIGDQVMAETGLKCGAYAEYICLSQDALIVNQPEWIAPEEATGILDGGVTALSFFTDVCSLKKGDKVLINGASGSIGTAAIQLAKYFGAEVTAVCSSKNKSLVRDLGADKVLDYTKNELEKSTETFAVIFDTVGKLSYRKRKRNLQKTGVFLTPVLSVKTVFLLLFFNPFTSKKIRFSATGLRKPELILRDLRKISNMLEKGELQTVIDRVYTLETIQEAHAYVDTGRKRGNVVISL